MIRIPACAMCIYCTNEMTCPAYPRGIPDDVLWEKKMDDKKCGNGVSYKEIGQHE